MSGRHASRGFDIQTHAIAAALETLRADQVRMSKSQGNALARDKASAARRAQAKSMNRPRASPYGRPLWAARKLRRRLHDMVLDAAVLQPALGGVVVRDRIRLAIAFGDQHVRVCAILDQRLAHGFCPP